MFRNCILILVLHTFFITFTFANAPVDAARELEDFGGTLKAAVMSGAMSQEDAAKAYFIIAERLGLGFNEANSDNKGASKESKKQENQERSGAPKNVMLLQAAIVSIICMLGMLINLNDVFYVLTVISAQIYLVMYALMFVSVIVLRFTKPDIDRPFRIPGGTPGLWIVAGTGFFPFDESWGRGQSSGQTVTSLHSSFGGKFPNGRKARTSPSPIPSIIQSFTPPFATSNAVCGE